MEQTLTPSSWEPYSDEADHYSYVRCLSLGTLYEVLRVTHDKQGQQAEFVHQVIFMAEYDEQALSEILQGFGYKDLDAFVREVNHADVDPTGFIIRPDGRIDRKTSSGWWIDYMLLASLMAEHFTGRTMAVQIADALAETIVKPVCELPDPFCIRRTFMDQLMSIPLTKAEVNSIFVARAEEIRMEYLRDEITDLDEDDPCFEGRAPKSLLCDKKFLGTVQNRWSRCNGRGGDQTENLREAITVTIHELLPDGNRNDCHYHKEKEGSSL